MSDVDRLFTPQNSMVKTAKISTADVDAALLVQLEQQQGIVDKFPLRRWLSGLFIVLVAGWLAVEAGENPAFDWPLVGKYFFHPQILSGLWTTLWLTLLVTLLSMILGVGIAVMRLSANPVISLLAWCYIWLFRATPLLVQLLFWFNIGYLVPKLNIGLPGFAPLWSIPTNDLISALGASILGLTLHGVGTPPSLSVVGCWPFLRASRKRPECWGCHPDRSSAKLFFRSRCARLFRRWVIS